jgi:hypothetical protein
MWDIGDQLGFDRDLTISIAQYLKGEGLLEFRALGGIISITHYGNKEVEENLKNMYRFQNKYYQQTQNVDRGHVWLELNILKNITGGLMNLNL